MKMQNPVKPISVIILSAGLILMSLNIAAQTDTVLTAGTEASETPVHSLYTSFGYGTNMIYLGSTISQNQSYGYGSLIYGFKDELYASFSGVHLDHIDPFMAFFIGSVSYNRTFNSWFDISAGIYRYQFSKPLNDTLFSSFFYGDLTFGFDWKILYSKISAGTIFSGGKQGYLQVRNSRYFQTSAFGKKKAYFAFDPYFNILFGSLTRTETSTDTIITVSSPFLKNISGTGSGNGNGSGNGRGNGNGSGASTTTGSASTSTSSQTAASSSYTSDFDLMEIDFGVPVSFNINRITFEAEPGYILPIFDDPIYRSMKGFVFTFSIYYKIF